MIAQKFKFASILPVIFAGILMLSSAAYSQQDLTPQQRRQLQAQIDNLKQRVVQVEQLLQAFDSNLARGFLQDAKKLGQQIESEFRMGRYTSVQALIRSANKMLDRILAIATDSTLKRLVNELNRVMRQAEFEVIGSGNKDAERLLQNAKKFQQRAEQALQNAQIQKTYEHLTVAITYAKQSLDFVRNRCQREHAQFQSLVGRAQHAIDAAQDSRAKTIYDQAFKSFTLAEQACQEGRTEAAAQLYNRAMRLLIRAVDLTSDHAAAGESYVRQELETVKEMLLSIKNRLDLSRQTRVQVLLRRAEENVGKAENLLASGRPALAKAQLTLARRLLENVLRIGAPSGDDLQEKAESELRLLQQDLARLETTAPPTDAVFIDFLQLARNAAAQAEQAIARGRYASALQRILVGQRFLAKAENSKAARSRQNVTAALAERSIEELKQRLREAEQALGASPASYTAELLKDAAAMLRQAENKQRERKYLLALELSVVGKELIATALRSSQSQD